MSVIQGDAILLGRPTRYRITVTTAEGAAVTAVQGSKTVTGTVQGGSCRLEVPTTGVWTVSAVLNGAAATRQVNVEGDVALELLLVSPVLNENS